MTDQYVHEDPFKAEPVNRVDVGLPEDSAGESLRTSNPELLVREVDQLGIREVVCLGDVIGYGPDPGPVTRIVMQRCRWVIQGNHDWGLFHSVDDFNPLAREALFYTRRKLQPSVFAPGRRAAWQFLRDLPPRREDFGYLFCHGSPRDPVMEYVLRSDGLLEPEKMHRIFECIQRYIYRNRTEGACEPEPFRIVVDIDNSLTAQRDCCGDRVQPHRGCKSADDENRSAGRL